MPDPHLIELLHEASQRLVRTVDGLTTEDWRAPSLLPGWSRAHVAAHLVLNAEGLGGALEGLAAGEPVPMYVSPEARDEDIDALSVEDAGPVRDRLMASTTRFLDALHAVPGDGWDQTIERVPGGRTFPAAAVPAMRWREVEIHHADLGAGYGPTDWSTEFADALVDTMAARLEQAPGFGVRLLDVDRSREIGVPDGDDPWVSGSAAAVAWWLSGRGEGEDLHVEGGTLPQIGDW